MKRNVICLFLLLICFNVFGQFSVAPDSVTVVLDPNETDSFLLFISNLTPHNVSIWMEVNYLTEHFEVSSSSNQDDTWLNINSGMIYSIPPNPMYVTMIPVNSNNLVDVVKTAELIVHTDLFGDFTVFVTLVVNPYPSLYPPQNLFVDQFGYATWEAPAPSEDRGLFGYNIYLDGCFLAFTNDCCWIYGGLTPGQTYTAGISAVYDNGESNIVNFIFIYNPFLNPVQNLQIDEFGFATWEPPDPMNSSRDFLGYNVYLNDDFIIFSTDEFYDYSSLVLIPGELYVGGVTAVYDEGESTTDWEPFQYLPEPFYPPENLTIDNTTCTIFWEEPTSCYDIENYNIYLNDTFEGITNETEWQFLYLVNGTIYTAGVQTIYNVGESDIITIQFEPTKAEDIIPTQELQLTNYPNPFNPVTTIKFDIKENETGTLTIYNIKGQTLFKKKYENGYHTFNWEADDYASGIYFYKLRTQSYSKLKKMSLIK
ncbi:MAG: T9SS type A sorting domain-containing protein [Candidatus Cloacimonetes bacterium]|nr:T9SS type A sorting domain-containing protein [Candidatus Cloacimonadota bacterium]MCF7815145.1 T9SS type A sorting domain-containing protein [Candidatus Cloacimonadota bacterium]MCF7869225.1 T9SS type A sorting domain-containing protein [Candidatus Cloacimonadota bacterium]MCF7884764.1 T9SS type A sorting domain-containing protein [Candidatus Cloacimonadota bacterium]